MIDVTIKLPVRLHDGRVQVYLRDTTLRVSPFPGLILSRLTKRDAYLGVTHVTEEHGGAIWVAVGCGNEPTMDRDEVLQQTLGLGWRMDGTPLAKGRLVPVGNGFDSDAAGGIGPPATDDTEETGDPSLN